MRKIRSKGRHAWLVRFFARFFDLRLEKERKRPPRRLVKDQNSILMDKLIFDPNISLNVNKRNIATDPPG